MFGVGFQPAGLSVAGFGAFEPSTPDPVASFGARYITPDGDYLLGEDGAFVEIPEVVQQVMIAISTELSSSTADMSLGVVNPTKVTDSYVSEVRNSALSALRPLIDAGKIQIIRIDVERFGSNRTTRTVHFYDLKTGKKLKTPSVPDRLVSVPQQWTKFPDHVPVFFDGSFDSSFE